MPYVPKLLTSNELFSFVSAGIQGSSHPFHSHGTTWNYMLHGEKEWFFHHGKLANDNKADKPEKAPDHEPKSKNLKP